MSIKQNPTNSLDISRIQDDMEFLESLQDLPKQDTSQVSENFTDLNVFEKDKLTREKQSIDFWRNFNLQNLQEVSHNVAPQQENVPQQESVENEFTIYKPAWELPQDTLPTLSQTQLESNLPKEEDLRVQPSAIVRLEEEEKDHLMETLQTYRQEKEKMSKGFVGWLLLCCGIVLCLALFKIYVRNNIYYLSREIIVLQTQLDVLKEENKHIKKQLEDVKFQNLTQEFDF